MTSSLSSTEDLQNSTFYDQIFEQTLLGNEAVANFVHFNML